MFIPRWRLVLRPADENASCNPVWEPCALGGSGIRLDREERREEASRAALKIDLQSLFWAVTFPTGTITTGSSSQPAGA